MHDLNVVIVGGGSFAIEALRIAHQRNAAHIHLVERHSYWVLPTFADTILHDGIIRPSLNFSDDFQARTMQLEKWLIDYYRQQNLEHLIPTKENRAFDVRVSTSDEFFKLLQQQNIEAHIGEIAETYYGGVKLHDDRIIKADLIIAATGYCDPEFEFLSNIAPEGVQVYQGWMLSKDPRIAFVGFLDMLTSSTAVIPLNLELAFRSMQDVSYRPKLNRVTRWIDKMPVDLLSNVKSHYSWLNEEKQFLDAEAIKHKASGSNCFLDSLNDFARLNSHSTAVVCENVSLSYGELNLRANIFASFLKDKKIKSVIACLPHCAESLVVTLGFLKSGIDAILFDVKSSEDFLSIFRAEQFDAVCIDVSFVDLLKQPITMGNYDQCVTIVLGSSNGADLGNVFEIDELIDIKTEESLAEEYTDTDTDTDTDADAKHSSHLTFYTSGTTGCAKGVRHSLISLQEAVIGFEQTLFSANLSKESRLILINRVTHLGGFMAAFSVLSNGGTLFLKQGFRSAEMIETISLHKPTHLVMFTAWLSDLVEDEKFQHSTLNSVCVVIGGESIPTGLYRNLCRESSVKLVGTFGISECGPLFLKTYNAESINDCGDPLPGVEFKIMRDKVSNDRGVGELWVKSRSMFQCYRGDPQRTSDNLNSQAWFKTGDMVSLNESGHVVIHGRAKDRISPNFFIQDIEYAILEYPSIRQVCAGWCELENNQLALKINIVLASNVKSIPENELKQKLYSVFPMLINDLKFEIVRELLRNRNGKIVRPIIERIEQKKIRSHKLKNYRVIMFPGQGSQHIGMLDGFDGISEFKELIEFSEDFCGKRFTDICSNGPEVLLTKTNVCQVSVFLASYFELRMAMQRDSGFIERCEYMLGLSLGEYTALVATGALSDEDAIRLLHVRGNAMRNASSRDNQKMVSINGLSLEQMQLLNNLVQYENSVFLANDLTDNHIVIAGDESGCKKVLKFAEKEGARCTILPVEGAFHTKYMSAVGSELENVLQTIELSKPCVPIICNVDALPSNNIIQLRSNLIKQVDHPVLFKQSLLFLHKETIVPSEIYTCGPGSILENIVHEAWNSFEIASINVL